MAVFTAGAAGDPCIVNLAMDSPSITLSPEALVAIVVGICLFVGSIAYAIFQKAVPPRYRDVFLGMTIAGILVLISTRMQPGAAIAMLIFAALIAIGFWNNARDRARLDEITNERSDALDNASRALGLSYARDGQSLWAAGIRQTLLFHNSGSISNLITGMSSKCPVSICDYEYTVDAENSVKTHWQTVFCFPCDPQASPDFCLSAFDSRTIVGNEKRMEKDPGHQMPDYAARPFFQAVAGLAGVNLEARAEFPDRTAFRTKYELRAPDPEAARNAFGSSILDFLEALELPVCVEKTAGWFLVYRRNLWISPDDLRNRLNEATRLREMFFRNARAETFQPQSLPTSSRAPKSPAAVVRRVLAIGCVVFMLGSIAMFSGFALLAAILEARTQHSLKGWPIIVGSIALVALSGVVAVVWLCIRRWSWSKVREH